MKYIFVFILFIYSCSNSIKEDILELKKNDISYAFYYDDEEGLYVLNKYMNDSIPIDSTLYYRDSLKEELVSVITIITKNNAQKINQFIHYENNQIDSSKGYFFKVDQFNNKLGIKVSSIYNDSIYLIIGEIDSNYNNVGKVDSFNIENNRITIPAKSYYKRARLGVFEKSDSNIFTGKEMYVPAKYLEQE